MKREEDVIREWTRTKNKKRVKERKEERARKGQKQGENWRKEKRMVLKKERDSNQDISAYQYIILLASRYLRAEPAGLADITARSCILLLMAPGMLVNFVRVKRSTVRTFTDTAVLKALIWCRTTTFSRVYSTSQTTFNLYRLFLAQKLFL